MLSHIPPMIFRIRLACAPCPIECLPTFPWVINKRKCSNWQSGELFHDVALMFGDFCLFIQPLGRCSVSLWLVHFNSILLHWLHHTSILPKWLHCVLSIVLIYQRPTTRYMHLRGNNKKAHNTPCRNNVEPNVRAIQSVGVVLLVLFLGDGHAHIPCIAQQPDASIGWPNSLFATNALFSTIILPTERSTERIAKSLSDMAFHQIQVAALIFAWHQFHWRAIQSL